MQASCGVHCRLEQAAAAGMSWAAAPPMRPTLRAAAWYLRFCDLSEFPK